METKNELTIDGLKQFIEKAIKLGKYPSNTASGYLVAIKTVERALLDEEPRTINYLIDHVEELFVRQNDSPLSPQSIPIYIGRLKSVCNDFKTYGTDGTAIYRWTRVARKKKDSPKEQTKKEEAQTPRETFNENNFSSQHQTENGTKLNLVSWRLRPGVVIRIELPEDLSEQDVKKIKALLDIELGIGL